MSAVQLVSTSEQKSPGNVTFLRDRVYISSDKDVAKIRDWISSGEARIVNNHGGYTWVTVEDIAPYLLVKAGELE